MSLQIAIDQIQRPTWWVVEEPRRIAKRETQPAVILAQGAILEYLKQQGGKASGKAIQKEFGWTNSKMWHYLNDLLARGEIIKHKPRHDMSIIELAKKP